MLAGLLCFLIAVMAADGAQRDEPPYRTWIAAGVLVGAVVAIVVVMTAIGRSLA
jgi:hypothetical protein